MAVVGVLVEAEVGHEHHRVADVVAQVRAARPARCRRGPRRRSPSASLSLGDAEQDDRADPEVGQLGHLLAERLAGVLHDARQRADRVRARRCPRARTAARRGRRRRAGSRPPAAAAPGCAAAGAGGAAGSSCRRGYGGRVLGGTLQLAAEEVEDQLGPLHPVPGRARPGQLVALGREPVVLLLAPEHAAARRTAGRPARCCSAGRSPSGGSAPAW